MTWVSMLKSSNLCRLGAHERRCSLGYGSDFVTFDLGAVTWTLKIVCQLHWPMHWCLRIASTGRSRTVLLSPAHLSSAVNLTNSECRKHREYLSIYSCMCRLHTWSNVNRMDEKLTYVHQYLRYCHKSDPRCVQYTKHHHMSPLSRC